MTSYDVTIIGAGPYGLSAAAHLRTIKGLEVGVFGEPMSFWDQNMPAGMFLRSNWTATQIADPHHSLTLETFQETTGNSFSLPVPLDQFVQYGQWYQQRAVPDVDRRRIVDVEVAKKGFRLTVEDGETVHSQRVIIAAGIGSFARRPQEFRHLANAHASHSSEHRDFRRFDGKRVLVIGSGQSALESAALLHESGAGVEVVGRAHRINWLQGRLSKTLHHRLGKFTRRLLYAPTDVGPAGLSQLMARPDLLRCLPRGLQDKLRKRAVRPAGARWLVDRLKDVPIRLGTSVSSTTPRADQVTVRLDDGSEQRVDHILLGTGYRVDVSKYEFLNPRISEAISCVNGYPVLREGLESSVPGLHFLGAPAVWSLGPLMQFVSGTRYASQAITRYIGAEPEAARGRQIASHGRSVASV
ncbi:MAG: FAD-dependent oxidoreductase [Bryobacteraceae bacterium]|jgi:cation diffusion facilitator CzcD-associated flavoprotein CzcO